MASEKITTGYFFTTSKFSNDAIEFANKNKMTLINGQDLINIIQSFKTEQQKKLFQIATNGDYKTPTCPNCDVKMIKRNSERGEFWGCVNYPRCKSKLQIRK
jgi:restriction system protein